MFNNATSLILLFLFCSMSANAAVIWDESVDGDTGIWWDSGQYLGAVSEGDQVFGTLEPFPAPDYVVADGYVFDLYSNIEIITIRHLGGEGESSTQIYSCVTTTGCRTRVSVSGELSISNPEVSHDVSDFTGLFAIGFNSFKPTYDYSITFAGEESANVSEPGAFMLILLGLVGLRRIARRKSSV